MSTEQEIHVGQGMMFRRPGGSIGGVDRFVDEAGTPVAVLWVSSSGEGADVQLRVGDTFEVGPERWEVTAVPEAAAASTVATIVLRG